MEADTLELIRQMKHESHPQHRLQFVGLEVRQFPGSYPGLDVKRESQTTTVKVTQIRQGPVVICTVWWVNCEECDRSSRRRPDGFHLNA
jgi:hypothetical protein